MPTCGSGLTLQAEHSKHHSDGISQRLLPSQRACHRDQLSALCFSSNDLPLHIHNDIDMFADDSTLHTSGANIEEIQLSLQTDLNVITTWCTDNEMVINTSNTKTMLITTKQRRHHLQNDRLNITLNELNLQQVNQQKVICVVVDENLKWREHVNGVYKKISQTLALFRRIKQFYPNGRECYFTTRT